MGGCFTTEEEINPSLSGLNDSRHVMMRRSSLKGEGKGNAPAQEGADGSSFKPREHHKLPIPKELEIDLSMDENDGGEEKKEKK